MSEMLFPYTTGDASRPQLGLIVLQSDVTLEDDLRVLLPASVCLRISRVPSATTVTSETLAQMEHHLATSAGLLPRGVLFDVVGYGCTSGTAQIGAARIAEGIREGTHTKTVTEPLSALVAACEAAQIKRIAYLSPYIQSVSAKLRDTLHRKGIDTPAFGTFAEKDEATVARIDENSIFEAGCNLVANTEVDALFLSCTNLRTLGVIPKLERALGLPVFSSNLVLAWHMLQLVKAIPQSTLPGDLL